MEMCSPAVICAVVFAIFFQLANAIPSGGSVIVTSYGSGFDLRKMPRDWMCCTPLENLDSISDSDKVLTDFASGDNHQKVSIKLSPASVSAVFVAGSGEHCRYILDEFTETQLTSDNVLMQLGTTLEFYAMKQETEGSPALDTYTALQAAIKKEGGIPGSMAYFKMMIVEKTHTGETFVGVPIRPY